MFDRWDIMNSVEKLKSLWRLNSVHFRPLQLSVGYIVLYGRIENGSVA